HHHMELSGDLILKMWGLAPRRARKRFEILGPAPTRLQGQASVPPPIWISSAFPCPKVRVSSGEEKFLCSARAMATSFLVLEFCLSALRRLSELRGLLLILCSADWTLDNDYMDPHKTM